MAQNESSKMFLLDTSIILDDPNNILHLWQKGANTLFITDIVLRELGSKKELLSETGYFAREFFRMANGENGEAVLISPFANHPIIQGDYLRRIYLKFPKTKIPLHIVYRKQYRTDHLSHSQNDAKIAEIAKDYGLKLLTNDVAFKIQALAENIDTESLHKDRVEQPEDLCFFYSLDIPRGYDLSHLSRRRDFARLSEWSIVELNEKEGRHFTGKKLFGFKINKRFEEQNLDTLIDSANPFVRPINLEQKLLFCLLTHPQNSISVISGSTGSGKTLMALQAGIHLVKKGTVDGIVYIRNTITSTEKEAELGFRKGDQEQKIGYFMYPLYSAVNVTIEKARSRNLADMAKYPGELKGTSKNPMRS